MDNRYEALIGQYYALGYYPNSSNSRKTRTLQEEFEYIKLNIEARVVTGTEPKEWTDGDLAAVVAEYSM